MTLNVYAAEKRRQILEDLQNGRAPREGAFDAAKLASARSKGKPQMGSTTFAPDAIRQEFIFPDQQGGNLILTVTLTPPERIVFMPVPAWVIESIWQGEVSGSAHFESDAMRLLEAFEDDLSAGSNLLFFGKTDPTGREQG